MRALADAEGIPLLDLSPCCAREELYFPVDRHWNVHGHREAARRIASALLSGELRPLLGAPPAAGRRPPGPRGGTGAYPALAVSPG